ncbi:MAG TPA: Rpp14/Pop5 family protein [Candidatus Nitrosocosmicus sp.]
MTLAKKKFRYICIYLVRHQHEDNDQTLVKFKHNFYSRLAEIFGQINFYGSNIRFLKINELSPEFVIIKCKLEFVDMLLLSLYFTPSTILILNVSGTIKKMKKRILKIPHYINDGGLPLE